MKKNKIDKNFNNGLLHLTHGRYKEAIISFSECISLGHKVPEVYSARGIAFNDLGFYDDAIDNYSKAIQIDPYYIEAYCNLGVTLNHLRRYKDASIEFKKSIKLRPSFVTAYINLGISFQNLSMFDEALNQYDIALKLNPNIEMIHMQRGITFAALKKYNEAFISFDNAISLNPGYVEAYLNAGITFMAVKNTTEALAIYNQAISLNPNMARLYKLKSNALYELKRYEESISCVEQALKIDINLPGALGDLMLRKNSLFDWSGHDKLTHNIEEKIKKNIGVTQTFACLSFFNNPVLLKKAAEIETSEHVQIGKLKKYPHHQKIRLGFYSSDFKNHPIAQLTSEFFEKIDKSKFEIFAFSFGEASEKDPYRSRAIKAFNKFIDVLNLNDLEVMNISRGLEIDIAIDLNGLTAYCRTNIFALRVAPIQIQWLGFLGSMGSPFIDYIFADHALIPHEEREHYSEKIVYLPHYQPNDSKREISNKPFTRSDFGIPNDLFVFCCFNNIYKITPFIFNAWMNILKECPKSILWIAEENEVAQYNIKKEVILRGVEPSRIIFAKKIQLSEYLTRFKTADLFLDTFPYNAGTVASDALRMGLPLIALQGRTFSSRMSSSLLLAINMPELVTNSIEQYEKLAIKLYNERSEYIGIKRKIQEELPKSALFNIDRTTKSIENAFSLIYNRLKNDMPAEDLILDS
jgi:predicted O-linked N-acetylglucosamine transferase (SPINDLY family)